MYIDMYLHCLVQSPSRPSLNGGYITEGRPPIREKAHHQAMQPLGPDIGRTPLSTDRPADLPADLHLPFFYFYINQSTQPQSQASRPKRPATHPNRQVPHSESKFDPTSILGESTRLLPFLFSDFFSVYIGFIKCPFSCFCREEKNNPGLSESANRWNSPSLLELQDYWVPYLPRPPTVPSPLATF